MNINFLNISTQPVVEKQVDIKILSTMILNNQCLLVQQYIKKYTYTASEKYILLNLIIEENDNIKLAIQLLKDIKLNTAQHYELIKKAIMYGNVSVLNNLLKKTTIKEFKNHINKNILNKCILKNSNLKMFSFLCKKIPINFILNRQLLNSIINDDNIQLFKKYINYNKSANKNVLLHKAMSHNAYSIISYLISQKRKYNIIKVSNYYNNFFDFLVTEKCEDVMKFFDKFKNIKQFGDHNLEKILNNFSDIDDRIKLLFHYDLYKIEIKNNELKNTINKYIIENKLQKKCQLKSEKNTIKKI